MKALLFISTVFFLTYTVWKHPKIFIFGGKLFFTALSVYCAALLFMLTITALI